MFIIIGNAFGPLAVGPAGIGRGKRNGTTGRLKRRGAGRAVDRRDVGVAARPGGRADPRGVILVFTVRQTRRIGLRGIGRADRRGAAHADRARGNIRIGLGRRDRAGKITRTGYGQIGASAVLPVPCGRIIHLKRSRNCTIRAPKSRTVIFFVQLDVNVRREAVYPLLAIGRGIRAAAVKHVGVTGRIVGNIEIAGLVCRSGSVSGHVLKVAGLAAAGVVVRTMQPKPDLVLPGGLVRKRNLRRDQANRDHAEQHKPGKKQAEQPARMPDDYTGSFFHSSLLLFKAGVSYHIVNQKRAVFPNFRQRKTVDSPNKKNQHLSTPYHFIF